jgi:hypothetical protein
MSSAPPTTIRGEEVTSSGNFLTIFLTKHKESAQVASYLSGVFVFVTGGLYFCGQLIGEFNSSRTAMAIMALEHSKDKELFSKDKELFSEKLQNEKDLRLKDKELFSEKLQNEKDQRLKDLQNEKDQRLKDLQNEKDQRLKDKEIADVKLSKKGYLW